MTPLELIWRRVFFEMDFRPIIFLLTLLPVLLTAIILAARAWQGQRQVFAARQWTRTTGRVISSQVEERLIRQRKSTHVASYRWLKRYAPQVVYEFQAYKKHFQGTRIHFGEVLYSSEKGSAERVLVRYPAGSPVEVYYNPVNPAESVLEPRTGWGTKILWLVVFFILGVTGWVAWIIASSPPILP